MSEFRINYNLRRIWYATEGRLLGRRGLRRGRMAVRVKRFGLHTVKFG